MNKKILVSIYFVSFLTLNFNTLSAQDLLGKDCKEVESFSESENSIEMSYKGKSNIPYGATASADPKPFDMIVFHWPGTCTTLDKAVEYGQTYDSSRGGYFGYHFYIDKEGKIQQSAPMTKRTNHLDSKKNNGVSTYSNNSAMGITLVCSERGASEKQLQTAKNLANSIQVAYNIPSKKIFGHGQLQTNREDAEGAQIASLTKNSTPNSEYSINYTLENGKKVSCKVNGSIPEGCSGDLCNVSIPKSNNSNSVLGNILGKFGVNVPSAPVRKYNDSNDLGDSFILEDKNYFLQNPNYIQAPTSNNNQNQTPYYPQPTQQQAPVMPASNVQTTPTQTNAKCTTIYKVNEKLKADYYRDLYMKNYYEKFGDYKLIINTPNKNYSFEFFFAKYIANLIISYEKNLNSCNQLY